MEFGDTNNHLAFTIHCGSRNLGQKVCKYWEKIAQNPKMDKELLKKAVEEIKATTYHKCNIQKRIDAWKKEYEVQRPSNTYLVGDNMRGYITDMVITTAYALFNHEIIARKIVNILKSVNDNHCNIIEMIRSTHNYIDFEDHIIRKGAIRAYEGEKMVVPFNMRDGLAICVGKSNADWNYSCSHGAGRKMSRNKAKELLSMKEFEKSMENVYSTTVCKSTLDESPMAYKDTNTILDLIQDTCEVLYMVKPLINIKSTES